MWGYTVSSETPDACIVTLVRPKGSDNMTSSGPTVRMPRRSVGSRYAARATPSAASGGTIRLAPCVPDTPSRRLSTGARSRPRLRTRRSMRLGVPACTRGGCSSRATSIDSGVILTYSAAPATSSPIVEPSTYSSGRPTMRPAMKNTRALPRLSHPLRVSMLASYSPEVGTGTAASTSARAVADERPCSWASGVTMSRCASTGSASVLMSSGMTKLRPFAAARARATR